MDWLAPFRPAFMQEAFLMGALVGAVCAVLSCYLVLKGWSLMGDAISHAVLPGIVLAYAAGLPLAVGAFCAGLLCAVGTGFIKSYSRVKEDTVMGVVFTGLFALGLILMTKVDGGTVHFKHVLFGNLLGIESHQIRETLIIGGITLITMLVLRQDLMLFCFDPGHARGIGLNTTVLYYLMLTLLSLTIVASLQAVGIILVVAMLVTPGCVGFLLADRFPPMMVIAVATAVFANLAGVYISFYLNASTSACIVLVQAGLFVWALIAAPKRGLLAARKRRTEQEGATVPSP